MWLRPPATRRRRYRSAPAGQFGSTNLPARRHGQTAKAPGDRLPAAGRPRAPHVCSGARVSGSARRDNPARGRDATRLRADQWRRDAHRAVPKPSLPIHLSSNRISRDNHAPKTLNGKLPFRQNNAYLLSPPCQGLILSPVCNPQAPTSSSPGRQKVKKGSRQKRSGGRFRLHRINFFIFHDRQIGRILYGTLSKVRKTL